MRVYFTTLADPILPNFFSTSFLKSNMCKKIQQVLVNCTKYMAGGRNSFYLQIWNDMAGPNMFLIFWKKYIPNILEEIYSQYFGRNIFLIFWKKYVANIWKCKWKDASELQLLNSAKLNALHQTATVIIIIILTSNYDDDDHHLHIISTITNVDDNDSWTYVDIGPRQPWVLKTFRSWHSFGRLHQK